MDKKTAVMVVLLHWYMIALAITFFPNGHGYPNHVLCMKRKRETLLTLKQGIVDPSNRLSSWTVEECCSWKGIGCDNITGHVIKLNLRNPYDPVTTFDSYERSQLEGMISDSLLELKYIRYLDLSSNRFQDTDIPSFFGGLQNLRNLSMSDSGFIGGKSSHQLANLSNLHYLNVRGLYLNLDNLK
ncbi:receptor-like protein EIX2 [Juglans microcarpa x Juglans regia]|uniref:receptor-like protein EIX2 n=1 Tax=Juglans microcarpa x Juglans regia TaxID=2249226 RepID=UPI001B7EEBD6|nr:receptor-like protein EIX2 [Juglans microcarpa x Juglans regia]